MAADASSPDPGECGGTTVARRAVGGFRLGEVRHEARARRPLHAHEAAGLCFAVRGGFTEGIGGEAFACAPFEVVLRPPGEPHWQAFCARPTAVLTIDVAEPRLGELRGRGAPFSAPGRAPGASARLLALRSYRAFRDEPAADLLLEGLLLELLATLVPADDGQLAPPSFRRATEYIRSSLDCRLDAGAVAAAAGVHPVQIARLFRKHARCTLGSYVRAVRVERAKRLLESAELPLADVALQAGFCDQSHLTRVFHVVARVTPAAYRRHLRAR